MSILLIGADGQLGSELAGRLQTLGPLTTTTRRMPAIASPASHVLELSDFDAVRSLIRANRPRVIVNAAAYTAVDAAESDRQRAATINAVAPGILAAAASEIQALLVHYSTDYVFGGNVFGGNVFGGDGQRPWREDDPTTPINAYGETKAAGEQAIRDSGATHLIIRTSWLYGAVGQNFVKTMLRAARRQPELRVVSDQHGSPTSAAFVAQATTEILKSFLGGPGGGSPRETLHVCCAGDTTWHGFAAAIFDLAAELKFGVEAPKLRAISSAEYPTAARRPAYSPLDTTKLRGQFGVEPPDWRAELRKTLPSVYASLERESAGPLGYRSSP